MAKPSDDDIRFRVMRALEANPQLSQRDLAKALGISLGVVNYCLRGLVEKGLCCTNLDRDSRWESSMIAGGHE